MLNEDFVVFRETVLRVVRAQVSANGLVIDGSTALLDLQVFDSLTAVRIVGSIEEEAGVEILPEALVPQSFESVDALALAFWRASAGRESRD